MKKGVMISIMYRDAANFKNSSDFPFSNDSEISITEIRDVIEKHVGFDNGVMVQDYGIPSIAPFDNEFLPVFNDLDHSYCEIKDVREIKSNDGYFEGDISDVLERMKSGYSEAKQRKKEAKKMIKDHMKTM